MNTESKADKGDGVLTSRYIIWAFVVGVSLIITGFGVESAFGHEPPGATSWRTEIVSLGSLFLKELGVAFLVASIIATVLEKQAKERDNQRAERLRREIADDAIFAIYGLRHRRDFINATIETNLQARIVREALTMDYRVRALTESEAKVISPKAPNDALQRFVILEMRYTYQFANVSSGDEDLVVCYSAPLREGAGARSIATVHYVRIKGDELSEKQIQDGRSDKLEDELFYQWPVALPLKPDERAKVIISARCVKERSDNEVWGCLFPTMGEVTLKLSVLDGMQFGVRSVSDSKPVEQEEEPDPVSKTWAISGPLLRHNSVVFWWRLPEDGGEDVVSPPIEFSEDSVTESSSAEPRSLAARLLALISWKR